MTDPTDTTAEVPESDVLTESEYLDMLAAYNTEVQELYAGREVMLDAPELFRNAWHLAELIGSTDPYGAAEIIRDHQDPQGLVFVLAHLVNEAANARSWDALMDDVCQGLLGDTVPAQLAQFARELPKRADPDAAVVTSHSVLSSAFAVLQRFAGRPIDDAYAQQERENGGPHIVWAVAEGVPFRVAQTTGKDDAEFLAGLTREKGYVPHGMRFGPNPGQTLPGPVAIALRPCYCRPDGEGGDVNPRCPEHGYWHQPGQLRHEAALRAIRDAALGTEQEKPE